MSEKNIRFQTLVDRARQEPIPSIDVAELTAERTAPVPSTPSIDWSLWSVAGLSAAAAAAVLLVSFQQGIIFDDPLVDWLRPLVMVMQ